MSKSHPQPAGHSLQLHLAPEKVFGAAITASDADTLTYTVEGPDAALFTLNRRLRTKVGEDYSYKTTPPNWRYNCRQESRCWRLSAKVR